MHIPTKNEYKVNIKDEYKNEYKRDFDETKCMYFVIKDEIYL